MSQLLMTIVLFLMINLSPSDVCELRLRTLHHIIHEAQMYTQEAQLFNVHNCILHSARLTSLDRASAKCPSVCPFVRHNLVLRLSDLR